jgi:uncharacterized Zn finger protein
VNSWYPPPSRPRPVEGGLKARSRRGAIGESWWSGRFIAILEAFGMGNRLARGKNYARRGQVIGLVIDPGVVTASVQGSRARPYRVRIALEAYGKAQWAAIAQALADNAWYAAKLLAGEMPEDIEEVFDSEGLPLFPATRGALTLDCSCPDWEVPCKHLAAVFYLLAEAFDEDPFLILAWRGRDREDLLDTLSALRTGAVPADRAEAAAEAVPLAGCLDRFYSLGAPLAFPDVAPAPPDALLAQLPSAGIEVRGIGLAEALRPAYSPPADDRPVQNRR